MFEKLGNRLFHYRNILFPAFYATLFIPSPPIFYGSVWPLALGSLLIGLGMITRWVTIGLVYISEDRNRQIHAETLVTGGMYHICRNPVYLGNILLITGFGVFANSLLFLTVFSPLAIVFYAVIIRAEESYLVRNFELKFINYKNSSNALLPKLSRIKDAFSGHRFNFKRVIIKEHDSLFLYLSGILLLLWYQLFILLLETLLIFSLLLIVYLYVKEHTLITVNSITKNEFSEIGYSASGNVMYHTWSKASEYLSEFEFQEQMNSLFSTAEALKSKVLYFDAFDFKYVISYISGQQIKKQLDKCKFEQIGIVLSTDQICTFFILRLTDAISSTGVTINIFETREEGEYWICSKYNSV